MNHVAAPHMLDHQVTDARAWIGKDLTPSDWTITLPAEALAELRVVLKSLRYAPLDTLLLHSNDFVLDACRATMQKLRTQLNSGIMFAVLDRLPVA